MRITNLCYEKKPLKDEKRENANSMPRKATTDWSETLLKKFEKNG